MNIDWFQCFLETVKCKSLLKASLELNISQPAASKQIKKLEEYYNVTLFKRSPTGMDLTEAGELLYNRIQPLLSELRSIHRELLNFHAPKSILLGTLPSLATNYLPSKILDLWKKGISVNLQVFNTSKETLKSLKSGLLDAAIIADGTVEKFFWRTELFTEPYYVVFPTTHHLSRFSTITLTNIQVEPLVVYPPQCDIHRSIARVYQRQGLQPKIAAEVSFGESILSFVLAGAGITILPRIIAENIGHLPLLAVPITDFEDTRTISLVTCSQRTGKVLYRHFFPLISKGIENRDKPVLLTR